jgi:hypothetical protein
VAELHRLSVGNAHDERRVEAHTDCVAFGQRLVCSFGGQVGRRRVMRPYAGRIATRHHEIGLKFRGIYAPEFRVVWILRRRGHDLRPFLVEVDEALRDRVTLDRIGTKQVGLGAPFEDGGETARRVRAVHSMCFLGFRILFLSQPSQSTNRTQILGAVGYEIPSAVFAEGRVIFIFRGPR